MKLDRVSLLENRSNEKITKDKSLVTSYIYNT